MNNSLYNFIEFQLGITFVISIALLKNVFLFKLNEPKMYLQPHKHFYFLLKIEQNSLQNRNMS